MTSESSTSERADKQADEPAEEREETEEPEEAGVALLAGAAVVNGYGVDENGDPSADT